MNSFFGLKSKQNPTGIDIYISSTSNINSLIVLPGFFISTP